MLGINGRIRVMGIPKLQLHDYFMAKLLSVKEAEKKMDVHEAYQFLLELRWKANLQRIHKI